MSPETYLFLAHKCNEEAGHCDRWNQGFITALSRYGFRLVAWSERSAPRKPHYLMAPVPVPMSVDPVQWPMSWIVEAEGAQS